MRRVAAFALLTALAVASVLADPVSERKFIREGMSEGEVLTKIGKPDNESVDTGSDAAFVIKRWIYLPTRGDSQTITTVVLQQGHVVEVDRKTVH